MLLTNYFVIRLLHLDSSWISLRFEFAKQKSLCDMELIEEKTSNVEAQAHNNGFASMPAVE